MSKINRATSEATTPTLPLAEDPTYCGSGHCPGHQDCPQHEISSPRPTNTISHITQTYDFTGMIEVFFFQERWCKPAPSNLPLSMLQQTVVVFPPQQDHSLGFSIPFIAQAERSEYRRYPAAAAANPRYCNNSRRAAERRRRAPGEQFKDNTSKRDSAWRGCVCA